MIARRREKELRADLVRRREREPFAVWDVSYCVACGVSPLPSTRHQRLDGKLYCASCQEMPASERLTKDAAERTVAILVDERNRDEPDRWTIYRCGVCASPQPLALDDLVRHDFYPTCPHSQPFSGRSEVEDGGGYDGHVLEVLAQLRLEQRRERLRRADPVALEDTGLQVSACARCKRPAVVTTAVDRLTGGRYCLECFREPPTMAREFTRDTFRAIASELNACNERMYANFREHSRAEIAALREADADVAGAVKRSLRYSEDELTYKIVPCACNRWQLAASLRSNDADEPLTETVFSACTYVGAEEREDLLVEYAATWSLPADAVQILREWLENVTALAAQEDQTASAAQQVSDGD